MTGTLRFVVAFHGPFAISTGAPSGRIDRRVDATTHLPSSSLKGLMKAEARDRLHIRQAIIDELFGSPHQQPSPWRWTDAIFPKEPTTTLWSRIKVDADGRAEERKLMIGEQDWAPLASFTVDWNGFNGQEPDDHRLVLRAAGRHISSLGSHRRRGLGWVTVHDETPWTLADSKRLRSIMRDVA